ncbi:MAG: hypothetical protein IPN53_20745 [Comamonadaceae bacterium]|nr:hypothetical protein [Comamonadaceae bacterium]
MATLAGVVAASSALAEETQGRIAIIVSPHTTDISAPGYLLSAGQLPKDHSNSGNGYVGFLGEINYGQVSLAIDYLTGTSDTVAGGLDFSPMSPTFNPLTYEQSETLTVYAGYNILDNSAIGKLDATLGYFKLWAQPSISPANWYDGVEIGIKGRRTWDGNFAVTYKLGYVPSVSVHGYMKDYNLMTGKNIWNMRFGAEIPVFKNFSGVLGYQKTRAENKVVVDGSAAIVTFSGFYVGAMYSF